MAKRKRRGGRKLKGARQKFGQAAKSANITCHRETNSVQAYKGCMRREMKRELKSRGFRVGR